LQIRWIAYAILALVFSLLIPFTSSGCGKPMRKHLTEDRAILYPAYGYRMENGQWMIQLHSYFFELEQSDRSHVLLQKLLKEVLEREELEEEEMPKWQSDLFQERISWFLLDSEEDRNMQVSIDGKSYSMPASESSGHSRISFPVTITDDGPGTSVLTMHGSLNGIELASARLFLVDNSGLSIVSDIDDTIKVSEVRNRERLIDNTFFHHFRAVKGMSDLYEVWHQQGAMFHYISGSPWQLFPSLKTFLVESGFPEGSYHLRNFHLSDGSFWKFINHNEDNVSRHYKVTSLESLLLQFPGRKFILVGDSGEQDPEVYSYAATRFPDQIQAILIRNVTGEDAHALRYRNLRIPPDVRFQVFEDPSELSPFKPAF